jgi:hypothetical protein
VIRFRAAEKIFGYLCITIQELFVSLHRELKIMVIMATTKLISIRVDEDDLRIIDERVKSDRFGKRSDLINAALRFMAWAIQDGQAHKLEKFWPRYGDKVDSFALTYHREHR